MFQDKEIKISGKPTSVGAAMKELESQLPTYRLILSKEAPTVIHFVDRNVDRKDDYIMNQKVSLRFEGPFPEIVDAIGAKLGRKLKQLDRCSSYDGGVFDRFRMPDQVRLVANVQDRSVRDLLTESAPCDNYDCFIWYSITYPLRDKREMCTS